ncbi:DNA-binding GntR family transcriptional regulator [Amycolatopsis bartoniae]|uniref:GntR family transcriptional regulator n=1 Tax=Amycolatopsis bartoniae TaxID=941986 RepID=A0A8H9IT62_9PSEU|nr:GntR family transcriptional regulator [Amycolatopsis bartoniae]MBB2936714.1 DNA-binding GntR family transcriptional regulator [Amycolatopsis bartoniae]TVS99305.1 GntR family transcriptional regulator [Amycolatopsis bartoniae]GHF49658.1 GntR family transcriptional regulator [Amycolatopsis bartoniae]
MPPPEPRPPAATTLLEHLRTAIYHGELSPGQRLVEAELARRHGTSRGAVREAIVLLSNEGLVARERNRGARVRPVQLPEAVEITEVRAVLEALCAAKAAHAATAPERRQLRLVERKLREAAGDAVVYTRLSQQLHVRLREFSRQTTAAEILERLRYQSVRYELQVALLPGQAAQGTRNHLRIIDAVCTHDRRQAEQATREHWDGVAGTLRRLATGRSS